MSEVVATPQQRAIIESQAEKFIVRAAAGSGKTFALVQRYLRHLLEEGCVPSQVLAFTYTRKASAEMRKRLVAALRAQMRHELAQAAETGPISTIHGFCERLLRANALEAGVDPEFEILGDGDSLEIQRASVRQVLASGESASAPEVLALVGELTGRMSYQSKGPYDFLESCVLNVLSEFRASGHQPTDLTSERESPVALTRVWHRLLLESLPPSFTGPLLKVVGTDKFYPTALEIATATFGKAKSVKPTWLTDGSVSTEAIVARDSFALAILARESWETIDRVMSATMKFDLTALEQRAVSLLADSETTRQRMRDTYRHVLVDEAQDLNPTQHRLIDSLKPQSLMLVGDGQQSIYGFRQADLQLFEAKAARLPGLELNQNYRSTPSILKFVDLVASSMWGEAYTPMQPAQPFDLDAPAGAELEDVEIWLPDKGKEVQMTAEGIRDLIRLEGVTPQEIGVLVRKWGFGARIKAELAAMGIESKLSGGNSQFFTRLEIRDLANLLRILCDPTDDFSFLCVLHSPLVGLTLDSIAALGAAGEVAKNLDGFVATIAEDKDRVPEFLRWFRPLLERSGWMSAWEILSELYASSGYLETLAQRPRASETLANVRKLLTLAMDVPEMGPAEFAERIADIDALRHREQQATTVDEDANAVNIMTIHSAKGLEFPIVILPETLQKPSSYRRDTEVDSRAGVFTLNLPKSSAPFSVYLKERRSNREREDDDRILYVALTRAEKRLIVVTGAQAPPASMAGIIARAIGLQGQSIPVGFKVRQHEQEDSGKQKGNLN